MEIYVGVLNNGAQIRDFKLDGEPVEILCNSLLNPKKEMIGPVKYTIHSSYLELTDCFSPNEQNPGIFRSRNYRDVFREMFLRQRVDEPIIALIRKESLPVGCFLCSDYPYDEQVFVARVSPGLVSTLKSVGRDFMKEI